MGPEYEGPVTVTEMSEGVYMVRPATADEMRVSMETKPHPYAYDGPGTHALCATCGLKPGADVHNPANELTELERQGLAANVIHLPVRDVTPEDMEGPDVR